MTKKRNPQDTTLRNINALKKRVSKLEEHLKRLLTIVFPIHQKLKKLRIKL